MADNNKKDKSNDMLTIRCPDMTKTRFNRIALARGTTMSAKIIAFMESVIEEEEGFIDAIADIFDYERKGFKERRVRTMQDSAIQTLELTDMDD